MNARDQWWLEEVRAAQRSGQNRREIRRLLLLIYAASVLAAVSVLWG